MSITQKERDYLRNLAKKQLEYANLPANKQREANWYAHNDLKGKKPMVTMEEGTFFQELERPLQCESPEARQIEEHLLGHIIAREDIDDDRVTPDFFGVTRWMWFTPFGLEVEQEQSATLAYTYKPHIHDLEADFHKLGKSAWGIAPLERTAEIAGDIIGDILPVRFFTAGPYGSLTWRLVCIMHMETLMYALADSPELVHRMMEMMTADYVEALRSQEAGDYLIVNNYNQRVSQGSYGFTHDLPSHPAKLSNMWGYMDSQETVGISCDMFKEFFFPYYKRIADMVGLVNYGCCEPVHAIWDECLSQMTNLRKVSVSAWCDEEFMGDRLRGGKVIFHRKPSPNVVGVDKIFDESKFREHIAATLKAARGCKLEFSFRDVYGLQGDKGRAKRCVQLVKESIDEHWV